MNLCECFARNLSFFASLWLSAFINPVCVSFVFYTHFLHVSSLLSCKNPLWKFKPFTQSQTCLQIRDRFKRKIHGIFPVIDDRASSKRSSGIKYSTIGNASLKKIEVKSSNKNSKLDDSTSGNASLKKIEVKPFNRNSKLDDCTGSNASLKKIEVNPSNRNSKLDDSTDGNAWLKNIEVNPSNRNTKLDDSTGGNAPLKKIKGLFIYYSKYFK